MQCGGSRCRVRVDQEDFQQAVWRDGGVVGRWNDREGSFRGRSVGWDTSGSSRKILKSWGNDENVVRAGPRLATLSISSTPVMKKKTHQFSIPPANNRVTREPGTHEGERMRVGGEVSCRKVERERLPTEGFCRHNFSQRSPEYSRSPGRDFRSPVMPGSGRLWNPIEIHVTRSGIRSRPSGASGRIADEHVTLANETLQVLR